MISRLYQLLLPTLFLVLLSTTAVAGFQSSLQTSKNHAVLSSSPLFHGPAVTALSVSSISMDSATATSEAGMATANPWDRACFVVSQAASNMNEMRQKIAKSGVSTAISYSLVSNAFTSVAVALAWYTFNLQTAGLSPLRPGQWKPFLGLYAGFYAANSLLKPVRFILALGVAPHTERLIQALQKSEVLGDSRKVAVACTTGLLVTSSTVMMGTAIVIASVVSGTPIFPAGLPFFS